MEIEPSIEKVENKPENWAAPVLVALIGAFMSMLDSSIVNVAIPTIMNVFGVDISSVQWVSTIYLLTLGVVVPLSGWLGDRFGFKLIYIFSLMAFIVGSFFCAIAWNIESLIFARVIQAIGGGLIMPTMMSMVIRIVPQNKIGGGMGIFGMAVLVAPAIGPTLGGYLVEYVNWRWIFAINLPIGVVGVLLAWIVLPQFKAKNPGKLDIAGAITSAIFLFCLLLVLSKGADWEWTSEKTISFLFVGISSFALFIYYELTVEKPLLDLRIFKYRAFTMANCIILVTMVGTYASLFFIPLFLQKADGIGAMQTGFLMMPGAIVSGVMMAVAGKLYDKIGPRPLILSGVLTLVFVSYFFHNLNLNTPLNAVMLWVAISGVVVSLISMPAQTAGLADLPVELVGHAAAIRNIISRVSGSFGIAILTSALDTFSSIHKAHLSWNLCGINPGYAQLFSRTGLPLGNGLLANSQTRFFLHGMISRNAFVQSMDDIFIIVAVFSVIAVVPAYFLKKGTSRKGAMAESTD